MHVQSDWSAVQFIQIINCLCVLIFENQKLVSNYITNNILDVLIV